jgi:hypothetical protein
VTTNVYPLPDRTRRNPRDLTRWISGDKKPCIPGLYLREFDEGIAVSEFSDGDWLRDGFFPSDIQDARWRGLKAPPPTVKQSIA